MIYYKINKLVIHYSCHQSQFTKQKTIFQNPKEFMFAVCTNTIISVQKVTYGTIFLKKTLFTVLIFFLFCLVQNLQYYFYIEAMRLSLFYRSNFLVFQWPTFCAVNIVTFSKILTYIQFHFQKAIYSNIEFINF